VQESILIEDLYCDNPKKSAGTKNMRIRPSLTRCPGRLAADFDLVRHHVPQEGHARPARRLSANKCRSADMRNGAIEDGAREQYA
jgi:hypothetical protein